MTTQHTPSLETPTLAPPVVTTDPRQLLSRCFDTTALAIARVRTKDLPQPTACDAMDVAGVLAHLVGIARRLAVMPSDGDIWSIGDPTGVADDGWGETWRAAANAALDAWSTDDAITKTYSLPWLTAPGWYMLLNYLGEFTVHTWDVVSATGAIVHFDPEVLTICDQYKGDILPPTGRHEIFEGMRSQMPESMRNFTDPFQDAVTVAPDSPLIDKVVAYTGRDPRFNGA